MPQSDSSGVVDPAARDKYLLQVTAGPSYDSSTHSEVAVNGTDAHIIENEFMTCHLKVRIRDYHGLPRGSPPTSDYFAHPEHIKDRYSIAFSFVPKTDIPGQDLVTGFDFDHSIRDRLPPGFRYAMKIVTTILDPGIYSDPYSDKPYLYGPGLSSFFSFRVGEHTTTESLPSQIATHDADFASVILEGADGSGQRIRADQHIPSKSSKRRKNFLNPSNLENFTFEKGRLYQADFFNPYLDFANFALRIPGFSISVVRYIDDKTHQLRFVVKNRRTGDCLFVVIFTLLFGEKLQDKLESEGQAQKEEHEGENKLKESEDVEVTKLERGRTPGRPETSSSSETPAPSSRSSSLPESDLDDVERQERQSTASALASSIYSGFAALGFGRTASVSSSEPSSKNSSPERPGKKALNERLENLDENKVEDFLRSKTAST